MVASKSDSPVEGFDSLLSFLEEACGQKPPAEHFFRTGLVKAMLLMPGSPTPPTRQR